MKVLGTTKLTSKWMLFSLQKHVCQRFVGLLNLVKLSFNERLLSSGQMKDVLTPVQEVPLMEEEVRAGSMACGNVNPGGGIGVLLVSVKKLKR